MSSLGGLEFPYHTLHKRKPPHRTEKGGKKENKVRIPSRLGKASGAIVRKERSCHAEWREGRGRRQNINDLRAEARLSYRQKGAARAGNHMPFHPNLRECRASVWCARVWAWFPELGIRAGPGWGALGGEGGQCRSHTVVVPGGSLTSTTPPPRRAPPHFSQGRLCTRYEPVLSEPRTTHPPSGGGGAFPERAATPFLFSVWYWRLWRRCDLTVSHPCITARIFQQQASWLGDQGTSSVKSPFVPCLHHTAQIKSPHHRLQRRRRKHSRP